MRFKLLNVIAIALAGAALGAAAVRAQTVAQTKQPPTIEDLRRAVASLRGDRISRPTSYDELTTEQKAFVNSILSGPRRGIDGGLGVLIVSPGMGDLIQKAIAYSRFNSTVSPKLNELAILLTARAWTAQVAWSAHHRAALNAGLSPDIVDAIQVGKRPTGMTPDVEAIYNFCTELLTTRQMSDPTFNAAKKVLGSDQKIVDLVGSMGLYQLTSMMMDVDRLPLGPGVKPELQPLQ